MAADVTSSTVWTPENIEEIVKVIDRLGWLMPVGIVLIIAVIVGGLIWIYINVIAPVNAQQSRILNDALALYDKEHERFKENEVKYQQLEIQYKTAITAAKQSGIDEPTFRRAIEDVRRESQKEIERLKKAHQEQVDEVEKIRKNVIKIQKPNGTLDDIETIEVPVSEKGIDINYTDLLKGKVFTAQTVLQRLRSAKNRIQIKEGFEEAKNITDAATDNVMKDYQYGVNLNKYFEQISNARAEEMGKAIYLDDFKVMCPLCSSKFSTGAELTEHQIKNNHLATTGD